MPVYNGECYLQESIDSVLSQTFTEFEFIIINDGSIDRSDEILKSYYDSRIRLIQNNSNIGVVATLNKGLSIARGELVARMDCDDVCMPERFKVQASFMDANPTVGICGSWVEVLNGAHKTTLKFPTAHEDIRAQLLFGNPIAHPTVMLRRSIFIDHGLWYDESERHAEDYGLWVRAQGATVLANIPQVLLRYRRHHGQVSNAERQEQQRVTESIRAAQLHALYPEVESAKVGDFFRLCAAFDEPHNFSGDTEMLQCWKSLIITLFIMNSERKIYDQQSLARSIELVWERLCRAKGIHSICNWRLYWQLLVFLAVSRSRTHYLRRWAGTLPVYLLYRIARRAALVAGLLPKVLL